jgi:hypothetical protein
MANERLLMSLRLLTVRGNFEARSERQTGMTNDQILNHDDGTAIELTAEEMNGVNGGADMQLVTAFLTGFIKGLTSKPVDVPSHSIQGCGNCTLY